MAVVSNQSQSALKTYFLFFLAIASLTFTNGLQAQWIPSVTFTNPAPQDAEFYSATIVAVGEDKVLIGTPYHDAGARFRHALSVASRSNCG